MIVLALQIVFVLLALVIFCAWFIPIVLSLIALGFRMLNRAARAHIERAHADVARAARVVAERQR